MKNCNQSTLYAIYIGTLCSVTYLAVYFARNILGAVTPQMIENGYKEAFIGEVSAVYFISSFIICNIPVTTNAYRFLKIGK